MKNNSVSNEEDTTKQNGGETEFDENNNQSSSSLLLANLELGDTKVYEPSIRALLGTALHFCKIVDLKLISVPNRVEARGSSTRTTSSLPKLAGEGRCICTDPTR